MLAKLGVRGRSDVPRCGTWTGSDPWCVTTIPPSLYTTIPTSCGGTLIPIASISIFVIALMKLRLSQLCNLLNYVESFTFVMYPTSNIPTKKLNCITMTNPGTYHIYIVHEPVTLTATAFHVNTTRSYIGILFVT